MSSKPRRALRLSVYGVSVALHVALAAGAVLAPKVRKSSVVAISLAETHKPAPKKEEAPPPPPPPPPKAKAAPAPVAVAAAKPAPAEAPPPPAANAAPEAFADLGLTMGNGPGGLAVPVSAHPRADAPRPETTTRKVRALVAPVADACDEPVVKAKLQGAIVKPIYTDEARTAQVEGVVRVELTVDEQGNVIAVKVLHGLGYGLDDSAIRAAKQMKFSPGTRCGKAAVTTLNAGMRFALGE